MQGIKRIDEVIELIHKKSKIERGSLLLVSEVGSSAHGTNTNSDDLDIIAIFMERWYDFVYSPVRESGMFIRTAEDGAKSQPGDIDVQAYSLRKFTSLLQGGNPSMLAALFTSRVVEVYPGALDMLMRVHDGYASKKCGLTFLGYMHQQLGRLTGEKSNNVTRPDLVEKYGFDTKYAGHVIRLGRQGIEYMRTGRFSMPMSEEDAAHIRSIREGRVSYDEIVTEAESLKLQLQHEINISALPGEHNGKISKDIICDFYREWYVNSENY
jgi:uncharacterized protein